MFISDSPEATAAAGAECARGASRGDVVALTGELGAGKTQFVKGFVAELGSSDQVTSPTFTLIHEYSRGRVPVYHFDFYRLESAREVARLGLDEYLFGDGVCIIEWGNRFRELLPASTRWIALEITKRKRTCDSWAGTRMKILAIDLSTGRGSIAWSDGVGGAFDAAFANDRKHSGLFFENLQQTLGRFGTPELIVVGLGPGSYAGTRIAIATASGLAAATGARLRGLSSVRTFETEAGEYDVVGDARRQSFFFAHVVARKCIEGPLLYTRGELLARLRGHAHPVFASEQIANAPGAVLSYPSARVLAEIAREAPETLTTQPLEPIYLREPHITYPKNVEPMTVTP